MDSSHVSLVELQLNWVEFQKYRCDRPVTFGIYLESLSKILKFASNDDIITISAEEDDESLLFQFENPGIEFSPFFSNFPPWEKDKYSEFSLDLVSLDIETIGIPET